MKVDLFIKEIRVLYMNFLDLDLANLDYGYFIEPTIEVIIIKINNNDEENI